MSLGFNITVNDPGNVLTPNDFGTFINNVYSAGQSATQYLYGGRTLDVQVNLLDLDSSVLASTRNSPDDYAVYHYGNFVDFNRRYTDYETNSAYKTRTGVDPNGASPDIVFYVNTDYLIGRFQGNGQPVPDKFWLDDTYVGGAPLPPATSLPTTQFDFITTMSHEFLHGLGFGQSPFANTPNAGIWKSRYDHHITSNGVLTFFDGPSANSNNNGSPIVLQSAADPSHVMSNTDLMYYQGHQGSRRVPSGIDLGILYDLNWNPFTYPARFSAAGTLVSENAGYVTLTITRDDGTYPGQIAYSTFNGTAQAGTDYVASGGTVMFNVGELAKTINIPIIDDSLVNGPRYFDVILLDGAGLNLYPSGQVLTRVTIASNETRPGSAVPDDFDNDGKSDFSVFGTNAAGIYGFTTLLSSQAFDSIRPAFFAMGGSAAAIPTVADYDGDGRADYSIYSPDSAGVYTWYWYSSITGAQGGVSGFGSANFIPVTGDFDGDGKSDFSLYGAASGVYGFYTLVSSHNFDINQPSGFNYNGAGFGFAQSQPLAGDFDGDGKDDYSLYTPNGVGGYSWLWISSLNGTQGGVNNFGSANFKPVVGDFDGDGKSDFSVYGSASGVYGFYTLLSSVNFDINQQSSFNFGGLGYGWSGAIPTVADYDGDGKSDYSLFSPVAGAGNSVWTYIASTNNVQYGYAVGTLNSLPIAAPFITLYRKARGLA